MKDANDLKKYSYSVIMTGYIGLKGTAILAEKYREKLDARFPLYLSREAMEFGGEKDKEEFEAAKKALTDHIEKHGAVLEETAFATEVKEGGFLTGLYELAKESGLGFELDLRKIPVRQETIEICEYFDINPYKLISSGSMLIACDNGGHMVRALEEAGIPASVIGLATEGPDRIVLYDGVEKYLTPPEPDEIHRVL